MTILPEWRRVDDELRQRIEALTDLRSKLAAVFAPTHIKSNDDIPLSRQTEPLTSTRSQQIAAEYRQQLETVGQQLNEANSLIAEARRREAETTARKPVKSNLAPIKPDEDDANGI